ncbi:TEA domain-containing protein [Mycena sanguinolenta]|uniref:TEA domain-containing protein n=1 Tax=Mycena sanguinolenta TaxID=230812 RepID=A0A8H6Z641_9AGAR|nr:TEA domain-containing protein [Mycena sanguinolenta]
MRNCFIAEYIFRTTGKRRSAKQVGSRLQQIRDSCRDEKLLRLLSPMPHRTHAGAVGFNDGFPSSLNQASPNISSIRHTAIRVNILPEGATEAESNQMWMEAEVSARPPCRISSINPTVAFSSPSLIEGESHSAVYVADRIVHSEITPAHSRCLWTLPGFYL